MYICMCVSAGRKRRDIHLGRDTRAELLNSKRSLIKSAASCINLYILLYICIVESSTKYLKNELKKRVDKRDDGRIRSLITYSTDLHERLVKDYKNARMYSAISYNIYILMIGLLFLAC